MKLKKDSDDLDANKTEEIVKLKKYLEVAALASAFNILGPDPESHQRSIDMSDTFLSIEIFNFTLGLQHIFLKQVVVKMVPIYGMSYIKLQKNV